MDNGLNIESKAIALKNYIQAKQILQDEGILLNKKDFTGQLGEWLVESIYDGNRAKNNIQKGWDVKVSEKFVQVKTHSKKRGNNNRWTRVDIHQDIHVDELIIIIFTSDYKLKEFYLIPWKEARKRIKVRGMKAPRNELNWNDVKEFRLDLIKLPKQEIVSLFM